jgi:undecaprenyl-diphosphatase
MAPGNHGSQAPHRQGGRIALVLAGIVLPLGGFAALVDGLHDGQAFAFDIPILRAVHALSNSTLDHAFLVVTALGYGWGVLPADGILLLWLAWTGRAREAVFASVAIVGALALDLAIKHAFARGRPSPWAALVHESSYSFPSGHAMASMTLAWVVALLCWSGSTRLGWTIRWPATLAAAAFVLLVGVSRLYLGLHYPSDILAGWTVASAWVVSIHAITFRPWRAPPPPAPGAGTG